MAEFTELVSGVRVNRLITKSLIRELMTESHSLKIVRSGVYFALGDCGDVIEEVCAASDQRKEIRIVLPSILNKDVVVRACEAGRSPEEVLARLGEWQERFAKISERVAPRHSLQLRTTMEPHRYHAIFSESRGIVGIPWHTKASLTTSSFFLERDASSMILNLHEDFDVFFDKCTPYKAGDNERLRLEKTPPVIDDPVLLRFGRGLPNILEALKFIVSAYPTVNGNGATKSSVHARLGGDASTWNKRLKEMEHAGLLRRAGSSDANDNGSGRLATWYGEQVAEKFRFHSFGPGL
jgi:hypothetical protein